MSSWNEFVQDYIVKYADPIAVITRPLRDHFGISLFYHFRIDNQGKFIGLTDRPDWIEYYSSEKLQFIEPYFRHLSVHRSGSSRMEETFPEDYLKIFRKIKQKFNRESSVVMFHKEENFVECSGFSGGKTSCLNELHQSRPQVLLSFIHHFKRQTASMMKKFEEASVSLPDLRGKDYYSDIPVLPQVDTTVLHAFFKELHMEKSLEKGISLSNREIQCMRLLLQGKSAKETAIDLSLSSRTIEFYFENIKNKLSCQSKHDLFFIAKNLEGLGLLC